MMDDLDDLIGERLAAARGNPALLGELASALIAGLSLTTAVSANGDHRAAGAMCESHTALLFEMVTAHVDPVHATMRGAA